MQRVECFREEGSFRAVYPHPELKSVRLLRDIGADGKAGGVERVNMKRNAPDSGSPVSFAGLPAAVKRVIRADCIELFGSFGGCRGGV
jgi:hypothetical protein